MPRQKYHVPQTLTFKQEDGKKNVFIRNEELGRGSFSIVYRVTHQYTNKIYAMKVISKKRCPQYREDLKNEIKIQQMVNHPNIVTLEYSFSDKRNHYFILEYCPGRNIREYLHMSQNNRISEPIAKKILKDVIQGLIYIHSHGITHYDIKLENFVIGSDGNVKIGDFGLSTFHDDEKGKKFSIFGTYNYLSPEMIAGGKREETSKADIWAVGVSAFFMLTGRQPFEGKTKELTFTNISNLNYWFPRNVTISVEAKNFIKSIFRLDPKKRPSAADLFKHPFLADCETENVCLFKTSSLPPLYMSPKPPTVDLKPELCHSLDGIQKVPLKQLTDNSKQAACQKIDVINKMEPKKQQVLNANLCKNIDGNKMVSPKPSTPNLKSNLVPLNDNKQISPKPTTPILKSNLVPLNEDKQISPKPTTPNMKRVLSPLNENKQVSPKPLIDNLKPNLCHPLGDNKQISPKPITPNLKPVLRPLNNNNHPSSKQLKLHQQQNDNNPISPRPTTTNHNPSLYPPQVENKQISPRRQNDNQKPTICPPLINNNPTSTKPPTSQQIPSLCSPLSDTKQVSPRRPFNSPKPPIFTPLTNNKQKPTFHPQHGIKKPSSPMPLITNPNNPRHIIKPNKTKQNNNSRPISARICILGDQFAFTPISNDDRFVIPDYFVSRYSFINDDMSYLLVNGTVGVCFSDNSRIVMDPHERFVQFYENEDTEFPDTVFLHEINEDEDEEPKYVTLVKKAANHFKKIRFSYDLPEYDYDPDDIINNVISFVKKDDSILFKLNDSNFQINFNDNMKLIIFWRDKKLCFFKSFKEKCKLIDLNDDSMNLNNDELMKFKNAKDLLSDLALTIC